MANPFVAEIRIFPFNFAPLGWAQCNGQILQIFQNTALFSLLGTTYGGDGKSTFALPNLQGRVPLQPGQGRGLSLYNLGQSGGSETVTLALSQLPGHSHTLTADDETAASNSPSGAIYMKGHYTGNTSGPLAAYSPESPNTTMNSGAIGPAGQSAPHNNMMPYITFNFCIALQGVFPPRS